MISKKDVLLLLTELEESGINCTEYINNLYTPNANILEILKFINNNKTLDLINFYEKIRRSYNHKSSKLYKNIVECDELTEEEPNKILTTLSALLNQILQFNVDDKPSFYKFVRADEIVNVLKIYFESYNISPAQKLLTLIKADLCVSEYINGLQSRIDRFKNKI